MKIEQLTLFELPPPSGVAAARPAESCQTRRNAPRSAPDALRVNWCGEVYALDSRAIDALERDCGPCEDENGVSLWRVLRDIHAHGARNVKFI